MTIRVIVWSPVFVLCFALAFLLGLMTPYNYTIDHQIGAPILIGIFVLSLMVLGTIYFVNRKELRKSKPKHLPIAMDIFVFVVPLLLGFVLGVFL
jgi:hypothetical protein